MGTAAPGPGVAEIRRALADAQPTPFWLSQPEAPAPADPLAAAESADLAVVGGGFRRSAQPVALYP